MHIQDSITDPTSIPLQKSTMLSQTSLEQCRSFHHNNNIQAVLWHHIFHPKEKPKDVHWMVTNVPNNEILQQN